MNNTAEYEARGLTNPGQQRQSYEASMLSIDAAEVAKIPEGRRLLHWLITNARKGTRGASGDWRDYYNLGRRDAAEALDDVLRVIMPREMYLEILYPVKEEYDGSS